VKWKGFKTVGFFKKLNALTLGLVFLLIFVGGLVRSTGSGMGCPDWPKCFGMWIPPTSESQLPANYQDIYAHRGYKDTQFNALKTWTEYGNRLLGASVGLFILGTFFSSLVYRKTQPSIPISQGLAVITVGVQGWLGSVVVATNLHPVIITIHMGLAFLLIGCLMFSQHKAEQKPVGEHSGGVLILAAFALISTLLQVILGTQVRESVDVLVHSGVCKCCVVSKLGSWFYAHRAFSWLVVGLNASLGMLLIRAQKSCWGYGLWGSVGLSTILGLCLAFLGLPAWAQPLHLLLAFVLFAIQLKIIMSLLIPTR
jgi:cytochrome c oxidase assembly protein subunit 15